MKKAQTFFPGDQVKNARYRPDKVYTVAGLVDWGDGFGREYDIVNNDTGSISHEWLEGDSWARC